MGRLAKISQFVDNHIIDYYILDFFRLFKYYFIYKPINDFTINFSYKCNKSCDFCKVGGIVNSYPVDMSIQQFEQILSWLRKNKIKDYKIQGGEQLIYPHLPKVLEITAKQDFRIKRFYTNLLARNFDTYVHLLTSELVEIVYVHYLSEKDYTEEDKHILDRNLRLLNKQGVEIGLRHVIVDEKTPYKHLFEVAKKYNIKKIRASIAFPSLYADTKFTSLDKENLKKISKNIIDFIETGLAEGFEPEFFDPFPRCAVPKDKQWLYRKGFMRSHCFSRNFMTKIKWVHKLAVTINPDLSFTYCEACIIKGKKNLLGYKNPKEIFNEFKEIVDKVRWMPTYQDCINCEYYKKRICHGTCLANKVRPSFYTEA